MPDESYTPPEYPHRFPQPKVGEVWRSQSVRGMLYASITYLTTRSDDDWEAVITTPSGRVTVESSVGHIYPESWVPGDWGWDAKHRVWTPPIASKPATRKTSRRAS